MKKVLGGGLAVAFSAAGIMLLSGPSGAQANEILEATVSPMEVAPRGTVSVTGDACTEGDGTAVWALFLDSDALGEDAFDGGETNASGGLSFSFTAPADGPATYALQISCGPQAGANWYFRPGSVTIDPETGELVGPEDANQIRFDVLAATPAPEPEAPPAAPVQGRPSFTG